jgi:hypothetical protein
LPHLRLENMGQVHQPGHYTPIVLKRPLWVKDGPILSQTRSRSKGPLWDQVADATKPRGQCRSWVDLTRSPTGIPTAGFGASRPLRRIAAIVSFLNPQPALSLVGGNRSSCPISGIACRRRRQGVATWRLNYRGSSGKTRIEATTKGLDIRFVVTSIETGSAEHIYETLYCARGQAENLIKLHKAQLASDRTSCRNPLANQMRLILHTAAYWLMLTVRDAIPKAHALATAEFATIRLRLLKLGTRVIEMASRVRLAFAAACPDASLIRHIAAALMSTGP